MSGDDSEKNPLFQRLLEDFPEAFTEFYNSYKHNVLKMNIRLLRDIMLAENVTADCFLKLYKDRNQILPTISNMQHLVAFFYKMNKNRCLDVLRQEMKRSPEPEKDFGRERENRRTHGEQQTALYDGTRVLLSLQMADCLAKIPLPTRMIVIQKIVFGYTFIEIAKQLQYATNNQGIKKVERILRQGLAQLTSCLKGKSK